MSRTSLRLLVDEALGEQQQYWAEKLAGVGAAPSLPTDYPRGARATHGRTGSVSGAWDGETARRLGEVCGGNELLAFAFLVAALKVYLHKCTGAEDVVVGTAVPGPRAEADELNRVLALRDRVGGDLTARRLLQSVKQTLGEAYANQKYPFERALELAGFGADSGAALFRVVALAEGLNDAEQVGHLDHDLTVTFSPRGDSLSYEVEYSPALFREESIETLARHLGRVVRALLDAPDGTVEQVCLLTAEERREFLHGFNATARRYPRDETVHQLVAAQAARTPGAAAVICGGESLSYAELERRAGLLAACLSARGVGPGVRVAVLTEHSAETVVAILGVLKAGGAYVPLDPAHPATRLAFAIEDAAAPLLLAQRRTAEALSGHGAEVLLLDEGWGQIASEGAAGAASLPPRAAAAGDVAYVIYTSGSTGTPKGVEVTHRSLVNYVCWAQETYLRGEPLTFALYSSLAFDLTVTSVFTPLVAGGSVAVYPGERGAAQLDMIMRDGRVGVLKLTPSHLSLLRESPRPAGQLRRLIVGGEALETGLARQIWEAFGGRVELYNEYGPTEATVGCMIHRFDPDRDRRAFVPIGRPIANTQVYLLDERLEPVAENVPGELYIGGDCLAAGYSGRPALTAERFGVNPFDAEGRAYRTGDLARRLPGGDLEYLGRRDEQVKYHGHRVELSEIRGALNSHPQVRDSVVRVVKGPGGQDVMIAYYVARQALDGDELHDFLSNRLIAETVPGIFVHLKKLPLTLNGKVNHEALPGLDEVREQGRREYVAPRTGAEEGLCAIWSQVLGVGRVGVRDNFFELGGHSLLATQVIARVRETFGVELPLRTLFEARTVSELAGRVEAALAAGEPEAGRAPSPPPLRRVARDGSSPLSFAQQRLWFLDRLQPGNAVYNVPAAVRLSGRLDAAALARALDEITRRHEVLRATFAEVDGQPVQLPGEVSRTLAGVEDLTRLPPDEREREARRLAEEEARAPFDLGRGPLLRARLLRLSEDEHVLLLTAHHIVCDGLSLDVLVREVSALYEAYARGEESPLTELPVQYADYAAWQREWMRGDELERQLGYWRRQLADAPPALQISSARPRPAAQTYRGASRAFTLPAPLAASLGGLARREGTTLFVVLLAAFQTLLYRHTGQEDLLVGSPIANRGRVETEGLVGCLLNTVVLRTRVGGELTFRQLLARAREASLDAAANQDVPFELVVEALRPERAASLTPFFRVWFVLQNAARRPDGPADLLWQPMKIETGMSQFDLTLSLLETAGGVEGSLTYSTELFDGPLAAALVEHYMRVLEVVAADPDRQLLDIALGAGRGARPAPDAEDQFTF